MFIVDGLRVVECKEAFRLRKARRLNGFVKYVTYFVAV